MGADTSNWVYVFHVCAKDTCLLFTTRTNQVQLSEVAGIGELPSGWIEVWVSVVDHVNNINVQSKPVHLWYGAITAAEKNTHRRYPDRGNPPKLIYYDLKGRRVSDQDYYWFHKRGVPNYASSGVYVGLAKGTSRGVREVCLPKRKFVTRYP